MWRIIIETPSSVNLPVGHVLQWPAFPSVGFPIEIRLYTKFVVRHRAEVPDRLVLEFDSKVDDRVAAESVANHLTAAITIPMSLAANAAVLDPVRRLIYNADPLRQDHEFEFRLPADSWDATTVGSREVSTTIVENVVRGMVESPYGVELHRAMVHYNDALREWHPGHELRAVESLFVALDNLAPAAFAAHIEATGATTEELADQWLVSPRRCSQCEHEWTPEGAVRSAARRHLVLKGDAELWRLASEVRNGVFHGYRDLPDLQEVARQARDPFAACIRESIINLMDLGEAHVNEMLQAPYLKPHRRDEIHTSLIGVLTGPSTDLPPEGERHPLFELEDLEISAVTMHPDGGLRRTTTPKVRVRHGDGVSTTELRLATSSRAVATDVGGVQIEPRDTVDQEL